eukprot:COSAG02_NODE_9911_length_2076_cov_24.310066_1_plen_72_part_00
MQVVVQGATHHTPRPPRTTTRAALSFYIGARYLTVYPSPPSWLQLADSQNFYGISFASRRLSKSSLISSAD